MSTDAVTFLLAAHDRALALAKEATKGPWFANRYRWGPCDDFEASIGTSPDIPGAMDAAADVVGHGHEGGGVANLADAVFIAANPPEVVLLRVAQERDILAEHAGTWASGEPEYGHHHEVMVGPTGRTKYVEVDDDEPIPPYMCITCEAAGWPCRTVLGLAKAWGWDG